MEFSEAARDVTQLHRDKSEALMRGDWDVGRFDRVIDRARKRKEDAKQAYVLHVAIHGCGLDVQEADVNLRYCEVYSPESGGPQCRGAGE